jgi:hypothetical protein
MTNKEVLQAIDELTPDQKNAVEAWWKTKGRTPESLSKLMDGLSHHQWREVVRVACIACP